MKQLKLPDVGDKMDIANHRLQVAKEDLQAANVLLEANSYRGANNRAYYAVFHAVSAVLATEGVAFKKHKDTLAYFNKNYVATEIFPRVRVVDILLRNAEFIGVSELFIFSVMLI